MKDLSQMRDEWDEIARQNAFYGVSSAKIFENPELLDPKTFWENGRRQADTFLAEIALPQTDQCEMVEIGCGLGRMTHRFAELFRHVTALDVSGEMLARARTYWGHLTNVEFILTGGTDLEPIRPRSVDFVFSFLVLQHAPQPEIVLGYVRECGRVLAPGGVAFLQVRTSPLPTLRQQLVSNVPIPARRAVRALKRALTGRVRANSQGSLQALFAEQYAAWRGCAVQPAAVRCAASNAGLSVEKARGEGTQYTYYTLRKLKETLPDAGR